MIGTDGEGTGTVHTGRKFIYEERTEKGTGCRHNQDRLVSCPELGLFVLSDGMGEPIFGEEAADLVIKSMPKAVDQFLREYDHALSPALAEGLLSAAIERVSKGIFKRRNYDRKTLYGATLSCVLLIGDHAVFGNVGDSRGYIIGERNGRNEIIKITNDHRRTDDHVTGKECGNGYRSCKRLSKFMGDGSDEGPDMFTVQIGYGDKILLCTDGLHSVLSDREILDIVANSTPSDAVRELTEKAAGAGSADNISSAVISTIV